MTSGKGINRRNMKLLKVSLFRANLSSNKARIKKIENS